MCIIPLQKTFDSIAVGLNLDTHIADNIWIRLIYPIAVATITSGWLRVYLSNRIRYLQNL